MPGDLFHFGDDFANAETVPVAAIVLGGPRAGPQSIERQQMRLDQIRHMDVVTNSGPVRR